VPGASAKELKIGYVDLFQIFNEYEKTKKYDNVLEKERRDKETTLKKKKEEIKKMQGKLNLLKDEEQKKQRANIVAAEKEYRLMEREAFVDLRKRRDERMKEILEDIERV
ncbi:MAG: OmpH family outer membrane protein, partial [Candidatus Omnitrophota bacterium]